MKKRIITTALCTCAALLVCFIFFAYHQQWVIFNFPFHEKLQHNTTNQTLCKKTLEIAYFKHNKIQTEQRELLWSQNKTENLISIIQIWLTLLDEEEILTKKASLQAATHTPSGDQAVISFDRAPFNEQHATFEKWMIIESLLQTIRTEIPKLQKISLLTHHHPLQDYHLDFSRSWPVEGFLASKNENLDTPSQRPWSHKPTITIMLDPAGDAQNTGRIIGDSFERGITLQYTQTLKKTLETLNPQLRVILTRFPGETLEPLQNAAFSNRLQADLYVSINFYPAPKGPSHLFSYHFLYDTITDFWQKGGNQLRIIPYNKAYLEHASLNRALALQAHQTLQSLHNQGKFVLLPAYGIPFKPLVGIQAPAIGCEIGLNGKNDWQLFVKPLAHAINAIVQ